MYSDSVDPVENAHQRWFDDERRLRLARRATLLGAAVLGVFLPVDLFITGYRAQAAAEALAIVLLLVGAWMLRRREGLERGQWIGISAIALVMLVVLATSPAADAVAIWAAVFPPIPFFLFGIQRGLWLSLAFGVLAVTLLAGAVVLVPANGWSWLGVLQTAAAVAASTLLACLYEHARSDAARMLFVAASTDLLTGLANRRGFLAGFDLRRATAERTGQPLSLLVFDVDFLKQINDNYGHSAGDAAICQVAELVRSAVRAQDLLGRLGGDEFALLLPDTDLDGALTLAAKLRSLLREQPLRFDGRVIPITISIGAAQAMRDTMDFDILFAAADRQLYFAKRNGRDHHIGAVAQ